MIAAVATIALFRPGIATYDSITQYRQALTGAYDDWHPPAMARLWAALHPLGDGAMPMLVVQLALYWAGAGLIAAALSTTGRQRTSAAVLAIAAMPLFLGWQAVVVKDAQMTAAMLAAGGLLAWSRLRQRPLRPAALAGVAVLLTYAALVRTNAIFAVAPFVVMLSPVRGWWRRGAVAGLMIVATLAAAGPVNHDLLGAERSQVEHTQPLFDLAAIAVAGGQSDPPLARDAPARLAAAQCVTPFFWDPLGAQPECIDAVAPLAALPPAQLYARWAVAVAHHPLAYAAHRLRHWNMTERWIVPAHLIGAAPPPLSEGNAIGLGDPGAAARRWQAVAALIAETPIGWPIAWLTLAVTLLAATWRRCDPAAAVAHALLVSAITLEASFLVVSIASDLRYHLWPMLATALAAVLLVPLRRPRAILALPLIAVVAMALVARIILPVPPATYAAMLTAAR